jgi:hypothetical protein
VFWPQPPHTPPAEGSVNRRSCRWRAGLQRQVIDPGSQHQVSRARASLKTEQTSLKTKQASLAAEQGQEQSARAALSGNVPGTIRA